MINGLESLPYEERLEKQFVQPEKRRLKGVLTTIFQYLKDVHKEDRDSCEVTWKRARVMGSIQYYLEHDFTKKNWTRKCLKSLSTGIL